MSTVALKTMIGHPAPAPDPLASLAAAWTVPATIAPELSCPLPSVDSEGFPHNHDPLEERRVRDAMGRVRDAYLADPAADRRETRRVVVAAGRDALRAVLADRLDALAPASCCAPNEPEPCLGCAPWFREFDRCDDDAPGLPPDPFADDDCVGLFDVEPFGEPDEPRLTFATFLTVQASYFRSKPGTAAQWLARKIADLADDARRLSATYGEELDARLEVLERDLHDQIRTDALADGYDRATADLSGWRGE